MLAVQLAERDLVDISSETDETRRMRVDFPISSVAGAASTAVVYFELDPGEHTGMHTDSAEEIVLILSGRAEAIVGDERGELSAGGPGSFRRSSRTTFGTSATRRCAWSASSPAASSSASSTIR
jgi:uncharacterized cupin superfamily protein